MNVRPTPADGTDRRPEPPRSVRRWLAGGFALVALGALAVGIHGWNAAAPRRDALRRMRTLQRGWTYSLAASDAESFPERSAWWEKLLANKLEIAACRGSLVWIMSADTVYCPENMSDDDLRALTAFPELRSMTIDGPQRITSQGFAALEHNKGLEYLTIRRQAIDDAVLARLANLPGLRALEIEGCRIDGSGFETWPVSPQLKTLNVSKTRFDDRALRIVESRFPNLENLKVMDCPVFLTKDWEKRVSPPVFPNLKSYFGAGYHTSSPQLNTTNRRVRERFQKLHPNTYFW